MSLFCVRGQQLLQSHWHTAIYTTQNEITQAWRRLEKLSLAILGSLTPFLHLSLLLPFFFLISYGGSSWVLCSVAYWDYSLNGFNSSSIKLPTFFLLQVASLKLVSWVSSWRDVMDIDSEFVQVWGFSPTDSSISLPLTSVGIYFWWCLEMIQRNKMIPVLVRLYNQQHSTLIELILVCCCWERVAIKAFPS